MVAACSIRPPLPLKAWLWIPLLVACPASAAEVVDVRMGLHAGFTRLVVETDQPTGYAIDRSIEGEISVRVEAVGGPRRLAPPGELLRSVSLLRAGDACVARLTLGSVPVSISELRLDHPPRIVLDLRSEQNAHEPAADRTEEAASRLRQALADRRELQPEEDTHRRRRGAPTDESSLRPARVDSAIYKWVDSNGVAHYTTDVDRIPEELRRSFDRKASGSSP